MRNQVIIPDLNATEEVDLVVCQLDFGVRVAEGLLKIATDEAERTKCAADLVEAREALAKYVPPDDSPAVSIGYIPMAKQSRLQNATAIQYHDRKLVGDKPTLEQMNQDTDTTREWVQWGVKGHSGIVGYDYETQDAQAGGKTYQVASDLCIELYGRMKLMHALEVQVIEFNTLSAKKKTRSQSTSGAAKATSTAPGAEATITGSG